MAHRGKLGFVPPRYGREVVGGAEAILRDAAHGLAARGYEVEVLTSCVRDHYTWRDEYEPGSSRDGDVTVRRFPGVVSDRSERFRYESAIHAGHKLSLAEQQEWMNDDFRSPELFHYLLRHRREFRGLFFAPYMFWSTFACSQVAPERTVLVPCLHDEPYARLEIFRPEFSGPRGMLFLSDPEAAVARRLFSLPARQAITGAGVHVPARYDPEGFRQRHDITDPFVLYAGRREGGKGWELLLEAFARAVHVHDLPFKFVTMGTGPVHPPAEIADRVVDLGFAPARDRDDAFAAADVYIQPSAYESFSLTVMEAWLAGTLVVANAASEVVSWHCERSGAGLTYRNGLELGQCLSFAAEAPDVAASLASRGREYVLENYTWDAVLDRMETAVEEWL
ncbi:MAG TPA: glycosyltransferase family 4 protein [Thermoleophilaceae bacterium]